MQLDFHDAIPALSKLAIELADSMPTPIILIDGRAGSGKSTLAKALQDALFKELEQSPKVLHLDDLYPGWEGLRSGSNYLVQQVLAPLAKGAVASWQIWDWEKGRRGGADPGNGWREYRGPGLLIAEGCGSLSRASKELAQLSIWIESERSERNRRWRNRDGAKFDEFWPVWEAQEDEFYAQEQSQQLADVIISN